MLREAREKKRLTQTQVAEILGVDQAAVSQWETGKVVPEPRRLSAIAATYGLNTDWLLAAIASDAEATPQEEVGRSRKRKRRRGRGGD
jgi:transcriptional regulator with XRE-family HTH domain